MKALKLSALGVLLLSAVAFAEQPEYVTKEVTGEAAIIKGDKVKAKDEAKKAALREAVAQVAGTMVSSDTIVKNSQLISDRIYAKSEGYVKKYDITAEKEEAGVMKVTVKAEVGARALDQDLAAVQDLVKEQGSRTMAIVVQEQTVAPDGTYVQKGYFAKALTEALKQDGWKVVTVGSKDETMKVGAAAGHGQVEAKDIDLTAADYFLVGSVGFKQLVKTDQVMTGFDPGKNFFPVEGQYSFDVFVGGSAAKDKAREVLARVSGEMRLGTKEVNIKTVNAIQSYDKTSTDMASVKGKAVVNDLRAALYEYLRSARQNGRTVVMSVNGLADFKAFTAFKKSIQGVDGVKDVRPGTLASGKGKFDVVFVGTSDELAEKMSNVTWNKRAVSVTGADANSVELTVK